MSTPTIEEPADGGIGARVRLDALGRSGMLRAQTNDRLERLTELATLLTGAPVALISMVDADRQYFTAQRGLSEPLASARQTPLSHSVCRTVVADGAPLVLPDLQADPTFTDHPAHHDMGVDSYCGVPIRDPDGHVLGSFCVIDDHAHAWTQETVQILQQLAGLVTDAIASNQAYTSLIHDLQGRVLPQTLLQPKTGVLRAKYRSIRYSDSIGGDFYDALPRRDGGFDLVLGDVVGHGVESTHAAAQLRAACRAILTGAHLPAATVIRRLATSCADLPGCEWAAILVASVSPDGRTVTWARAGAMPPLRTGPAATLLVDGAGPPLGLDRADGEQDCRAELEPGQGVLFFTDGLVERRGEHLDIGLERLVGAAARTDDLGSLIELCCPGANQTDDIAVVSWTPHS